MLASIAPIPARPTNPKPGIAINSTIKSTSPAAKSASSCHSASRTIRWLPKKSPKATSASVPPKPHPGVRTSAIKPNIATASRIEVTIGWVKIRSPCSAQLSSE